VVFYGEPFVQYGRTPLAREEIPVRFREGRVNSTELIPPSLNQQGSWMPTNLDLYRVFVENVRELDRAWRIANISLNGAIRARKHAEERVFTNLLAFIQCAHAEALFYKTLYTPYGLSDYEIKHVHRFAVRNSVGDSWNKLVQIGLKRVKSRDKAGYNNLFKQITGYVEDYIVRPSQLRNKIAHGQWKVCLNGECTAANSDTTQKLSALDSIQIAIWKAGFEALGVIIEVMVESPTKAFHRELGAELARLNTELARMKRWTVESKRQKLSKKPAKAP
jgi:hypothetical protein